MQTQADGHLPSPVIRAANKLGRREDTGSKGELVHECRTEGTRKVEGGTLGRSGAGGEDGEPGRDLGEMEAAEFNLEVKLFPVGVHGP